MIVISTEIHFHAMVVVAIIGFTCASFFSQTTEPNSTNLVLGVNKSHIQVNVSNQTNVDINHTSRKVCNT
jgi:hypothetical protein